ATTACAPATTSTRTPKYPAASWQCRPAVRDRRCAPMSEPAGTERRSAESVLHARHGVLVAELFERQPVWAKDFTNLSYEWRRLFSELFGTFLLVTAGAGAPVVDQASH